LHAKRLLKFVAVTRGAVELLAGDLPAAEREYRASLEIDLAIGEERDEPCQTAAKLAFVLWRQGRDDEAAAMAELSAEATPSESVAAEALASAARARATANVELARKAVDLVPHEMLNLRADVLVELAGVLRGQGDERKAYDAVDEAASLYERKGNRAAIAMIGR